MTDQTVLHQIVDGHGEVVHEWTARPGSTFDPTRTTTMPRPPARQAPAVDRVAQLDNRVRQLHAWVTFCVVLVLGMTALTIVVLLQLGGWIRVFG